jgi:hypothetical protein
MDTTKELNAAQATLLRLIARAGNIGCLVYGRANAATAEALASRGLVAAVSQAAVVQMGTLEHRPVWSITTDGARAATARPAAQGGE